MRKRSLKFLSVFVAIFFLVGCDGGNYLPKSFVFDSKLPTNFLENNAVKYNEDKFSGFTKSEEMTQYDHIIGNRLLSYTVVYNLVDSVRQYGIYDFANKEEVIAPTYDDLDMKAYDYYNAFTGKYETVVLAALANVVDSKAEIGFYCLRGKSFLVPLGAYDDFDIDIRQGVKHNTEKFTLIKDGKISYFHYTVTFDASGVLTRKQVTVDENHIQEPELDGIPFLPKLKDYVYEVTDTKLTGYKDGKQVFSVVYPSGALNTSFLIDKYALVQTKTMLPKDAKDFSYFDNGNKYVLDTSRIDLTTGKIKVFDKFDFVIAFNHMLDAKYNTNKEESLFMAEVQKIEDNILLQPALVLFDINDLKGLANLSEKNYVDIYYKVVTNRFLNTSKIIVDENYEKVLDLANYSNIQYLPSVGLISLYDGNFYGLIKPTGEIVASFKYFDPFLFYNGYAYNLSSSYESVKIDALGNTSLTTEIVYGGNEQEGIVFEEVGTKTVFRNYNNYELFSLSSTESVSFTFDFYTPRSHEKAGCVYPIYNSADETYRYYVLT